MHLNNITKGILSLIFIVGLFKITGIEADGNQKGSSDSKQAFDAYDYSDESETSNGEIPTPKSTITPYFENSLITVYATKDVENITLECLPKNFKDSVHQILWYNEEHPITNGNTSLAVDKYAIDNKYRLTILNYKKDTAGNFSCAVLPTEARQYVQIEFGAPPENIKDQNGASNRLIIEMGLMLTALAAIVSLNYFKF
ncbi:hypothetical protein FF38_12476 [Lucilia cuprina]|uniref:Ig-like domain-containing protein n=1 Tax=Lucilia cuprina TaxID=7375 RepID=A0A0L0CJB6_LUCCU|nr:uncharacterized protein LOC111678460 [Lucilia cuprina]KNC32341.1 hypothetical protein FF38_12476 [Lucilia cuprina]